MASTTEGRLYIINLSNVSERLEIQFTPPSLNWQRSAKTGEIVVVGRNNPLLHYSTGTETISLKLDFFAEEESREDVMKKFKWLKSLTYNDGYNSPRPKVHIIWGNIFKNEKWVVESVSGAMTLFNKEKNFMPQSSGVDVTFKLDPDKNLLIKDVR